MKIEAIDIEKSILDVQEILDKEGNLSSSTKASIKLLMNRLGLNSKNSSQPPSQDPNREKKVKKS